MNAGARFPDWLARRLEDELTPGDFEVSQALAGRFDELRVDLFPEGGRDRLRAVVAYRKTGGWVASQGVNLREAKPVYEALQRLVGKVSEKDDVDGIAGDDERRRAG